MPIPETKRPAVERALLSAFGTAETDSIAQLTGGLSGALVFRIRVGGIPYLLRIEGERSYFKDPARWYGCMRTAAEAFLAPRVRYASAEDGVAVIDYIAEQSLAHEYPGTRTDMITELAQAARALHATPGFPVLTDYLDGMEGVLAQLRASALVRPQALSEVLARYAELAEVYRGLPQELVSSHNDLNPGNVLFDGTRLWLVDWESAFRADRWVDLATLANFFTKDAAEEDVLLRVYFGEAPDAARRARMFLARQVNHVFNGAIFLIGAAGARPEARLENMRLESPHYLDLHRGLGEGTFNFGAWESRVAYGQARLTAALENLSGPDCARAIAALAA